MTANQTGAPRPRQMTEAGRVVVARTGTPLTIMAAGGVRQVTPTSVTDVEAMDRIRAYIAEAHVEYAEYAAARDADRDRRDR